MKTKKVPERRCVGCMKPRPKRECIRICRTPDGQIKTDPTGKMNGRGAYICRDVSCLEKAIKGNRFAREFETQIPGSVYEELRKELLTCLQSSDSASGGGIIE